MSEENYGFINIPRQNRERWNPREKIGELVKISYVLKTESPLHIGSGFVKKDDNNTVGKDIARDKNGKPIIPGSTIKGCIEANFRYIVEGVCGSRRCDVKNERVCPLCNLFGTMNLGSRVTCSDAYSNISRKMQEQGLNFDNITEIISIPLLTTPKKSERFHVKYYKNIRFDETNTGPIPIWVTKEEVLFIGEILILNPSKKEIEMIASSIIFRKNGLQIGMGKNLGMGVLKPQLIKIEKTNPSDIIKSKPPTTLEVIKLPKFREYINGLQYLRHDVINEINNSTGEPFRLGGG